jgi:hypothetical protein
VFRNKGKITKQCSESKYRSTKKPAARDIAPHGKRRPGAATLINLRLILGVKTLYFLPNPSIIGDRHFRPSLLRKKTGH